MISVAESQSPLSRLLYTSRCVIHGDQQEKMRKVREIANASEKRNRFSGLTGTLLFVEDTFIQILEGPTNRMEPVFEAICCDLRHREINLVDLVPIKSRMFAQWEMALIADDNNTHTERHANLQEVKLTIGVNAREAERQMRDLLVDQD